MVFRILLPLIALVLIGIVVMLERNGIQLESVTPGVVLDYTYTEPVEDDLRCLLLVDQAQREGKVVTEQMTNVLQSMKVNYDVFEASEFPFTEQLDSYDHLILSFPDWEVLGDSVRDIIYWVRDGGSLMNTITPEPGATLHMITQQLGVEGGFHEFAGVSGIYVQDQRMVGSTTKPLYELNEDPSEKMEISLQAQLSDACEVYLSSEDGSVPLLWHVPYGEGHIVVTNMAIGDKYMRGFLSLAYSLMEEACLYPVINSSVYYLDDFPSPVPEGDGEFIRRDYGIDIASFYSNVWWSTILNWEEKYGIRHTGVIIEDYNDTVSGPFPQNESTSQFKAFGNMLLNNHGELGYHGYNHMPLILKGKDEGKRIGAYVMWPSVEEMEGSLKELSRFSHDVFPDAEFAVYVPPSNIISDTGRKAIKEAVPEIRAIASFYMTHVNRHGQDIEYEQEFGVAEDGIIEMPRIVAGTFISEYDCLTAMSELNFHFVQSHFLHPDDTLDVDRNAQQGWAKMSEAFEQYLDWITTDATAIREQTASEMANAVQIYDHISLKRSSDEASVRADLGGFAGEAWFLLRMRDREPGRAVGCTLEQVANGLYLVHATQEHIEIRYK
ncbi:MAG: DUF2194 domain-containing protein [Lachnospiraceae bacterium]|nr:DUF2194 domain-containing protein [Lachnospiraceae bacterium]